MAEINILGLHDLGSDHGGARQSRRIYHAIPLQPDENRQQNETCEISIPTWSNDWH